MAVPLGRTNTKPTFVLAQMIFAISLFFTILGFVRVLLEIHNQNNKTDGDECYVISVHSLFQAEANTAGTTTTTTTVSPSKATPSKSSVSHGQFFLFHFLTTTLLSYPLSYLLQRRKLVPDFVLTIYGVYFILCNLTLHRVYGGPLYWWGSVLVAGVGNGMAQSWLWCRRRELMDIPVSGNEANDRTELQVVAT
ncbi:Integral membrane protein S linking to the trans Golgi network, putative [Angomonas deanei]|uniref:Integral membrane protein S linking to the trans Golgi network, putative n=1 Tax=Angomonas deanei TaxID=59799 RepID=A0A7G2CHZ7_9TRYP|nr:Integral membrane protein S linking to the trans Golgi network, putative [Angomonas deanei]